MFGADDPVRLKPEWNCRRCGLRPIKPSRSYSKKAGEVTQRKIEHCINLAGIALKDEGR